MRLISFHFQADKKDTCSRALCECDKKLAEDLAILEDTAQMDYRNRSLFSLISIFKLKKI